MDDEERAVPGSWHSLQLDIFNPCFWQRVQEGHLQNHVFHQVETKRSGSLRANGVITQEYVWMRTGRWCGQVQSQLGLTVKAFNADRTARTVTVKVKIAFKRKVHECILSCRNVHTSSSVSSSLKPISLSFPRRQSAPDQVPLKEQDRGSV